MTAILLLIAIIVLPLIVHAASRSPETYPFETYLWVFILSVFGGIVSFKEKRKISLRFFRTENRYLNITAFVLANLVAFVLDLCTSAFSGILTFYLCESANMDRLLTAALVGISGFAGGRMLHFLLNLARAILEKKFEVNVMERNHSETD